MAEDFDLDRVISDPAYRRQVISRLNRTVIDKPREHTTDGVAQRPLDRSHPDQASTR